MENTQAIHLMAPNALKQLVKKGEYGMKATEFCEACRKLDGYELPLDDLKKLYKAGVVELVSIHPLQVRYVSAKPVGE